MLNPGLYIHSASTIVPAAPTEPVFCLSAQEPSYEGLIPPMQLRRMSKLVRMSLGAARDCLSRAGAATADAIIMGTAFGCLADTEVFLKKMLEQEEQMLTPTAFIQSTHNTPAGQIALAIGCQGYNNTLSQQGQSFESALLATSLYLSEHPDHQVLCGAGDELTPTSLALLQRIGMYSTEPYHPGKHHVPPAALAAEGVGFFLLSKNAEAALARISGLESFHEAQADKAAARFHKILEACGGLRNTDLLLVGTLPDERSERAYADALSFGNAFRMQSGTWPTDTAACLAKLVNHWPEHKERAWLLSHWGSDWNAWLIEGC
ncbi:MAG: beta-ketoacyl synthase chain length factor [Bacteroidetes bacterium]|nr:beta-ketoacyl synthase chain length factor [Bacteroidota bacterium]MBS1630511.1 beta-ketoacyl synthase chain length factor [Bacteroidota bacterium]